MQRLLINLSLHSAYHYPFVIIVYQLIGVAIIQKTQFDTARRNLLNKSVAIKNDNDTNNASIVNN